MGDRLSRVGLWIQTRGIQERRIMTLKSRIRGRLGRSVEPMIKDGLIRLTALVQHLAAAYPHQFETSTYTLPAFPTADRHCASTFSIPPEPLWASYCTNVESYLRSGSDDVATMTKLLDHSGAPIGEAGRVLEIGVA